MPNPSRLSPPGGATDDDLLHFFVDTCSDYAIYLLDIEGHVSSWNAGAERINGYRSEDIIGLHFRIFFPVEAREDGEPDRLLERAADDGRCSVEGWRVRRDGSRFWARSTVTSLRDPSGVLIGFGKVVWDLTESDGSRTSRPGVTQDLLTLLPDRALLMQRLDEALDRCAESAGAVAVLFVGLDRFKLINDSWGHSVGDEVLKITARRLQTVAPRPESITRIGGDEFVVISEETEPEEGPRLMAERLRRVVSRPMQTGDIRIETGCSIGIALSEPGVTAQELLRRAGDAMHEAKRRGRARHHRYRGGGSDAPQQLRLRSELRDAIAEDQLALQYQPIVALSDGAVVGAEALVRWDHPVRGRLLPDSFLAVAEADGLITDVDAWVMTAAANDLARSFPTTVDWPGVLALNVSSNQLSDPQFPSRVAAKLAETGIDPRRLCLETTETLLLRADRSTRKSVDELREIGVRFAVDDFGTGYASLSYLRQFTFDTLKIDRSFIAGLGVNPVDEALVRSVLELAGTLGLQAVAEGVETREQLELVGAYGGDLVQGYLVGPPVEWSAIVEMVVSG